MAISWTEPQLFLAQVMHARQKPKRNAFTYGVYYLAFDLKHLEDGTLGQRISVDRWGWQAFYRRDHGARDGSCLRAWAQVQLADAGLAPAQRIILITLPRVLGYVFNPVSFWFCLDNDDQLYAVISEVNNTFGQSHTYVSAVSAEKPLAQDDKAFLVSPFITVEGHYRFGFRLSNQRANIKVDHYDKDAALLLVTNMQGHFEPLTRASLKRTSWRYPLISFKVIGLIHYQALRLILKGVRFLGGPKR